MPDDTRPQWPFKAVCILTPHPHGQWCKKVKGKVRYFGPWGQGEDGVVKAKAALQRYLAFAQAETQNTTTPVVLPVDLTLSIAVNQFLTEKQKALKSGDLSDRQFLEYRRLGGKVLNTLGRDRPLANLNPSDFATLRNALSPGPTRRGNEVTWVRSIFKHAQEYHGVAVRYGGQFDKPSVSTMRKASKAKKLFTPSELRAVLKVATPALKAMILLGINGGMGSTDCAHLPASAIDLKARLMEFDRPKTGVTRVVPLWPETVKALREYQRPSTAHPELFFVTPVGNPWVHEKTGLDVAGVLNKSSHVDAVSWAFRKVLKKAGVPLRGFYNLRHTFRTQADATGDQNSIKVIMGQTFPGMDGFYLHIRGPEGRPRLLKVSQHVRTWLFGAGKGKARQSTTRRGAEK